ncbi:hypothetical protein FNW52_20470 [Flavobacterium sp. ZT3R18]|uniref:hypothetical protein n=1 Tax=Flavobacterium sp. ZT3R18 TaxID=2594429 RepID=UPI0011799527|nr:hypothetical protein [Flavobacterium sp. ZT3R18]TRX29907.1 hypothetical protein FNW52_20470 [Flavobacterium sp. ZT3R18]
MKNITYLLCVLFLFSCSTIRNSKKDKDIYIEEFKFAYFAACLNHGFDNSKEIKKLFEIDKSGYGELILGEKYFFVDSLARITAKKIKLDSLNSIGRKAEGSDGKHVFSECLCTYNSKWLDSIAKSENRKHLKVESNSLK